MLAFLTLTLRRHAITFSNCSLIACQKINNFFHDVSCKTLGEEKIRNEKCISFHLFSLQKTLHQLSEELMIA